MKKSFKVLFIALAMLFTTNAFAEDFDWSECWCNYGAGIEEGDSLLSIAGSMRLADFGYINDYANGWFIPAAMIDYQYACKIWKLPFTFGGYAGFQTWGWKDDYWKHNETIFYTGGQVAYHVMLPPEKLDVYIVSKIGFTFNSWKLHSKITDKTTKDHAISSNFTEGIGASYYFSDKFAVNAELGYPMNRVGIQLKF